MQKITKLYYSDLNKARSKEFHEEVSIILKKTGVAEEPDLKGTMVRFSNLIDELQKLVSYSRALENTPTINEASKITERCYRYLFRMFKTYELDHRIVSEEEYQKLKHEVIDAFPLTILRLGWGNRIGHLQVFITHMKNDWTPLLEKTGLMETFLQLEEQVNNLNEAIIKRSNEKANIEPAHAHRVMLQLFEIYSHIVLYVEAWSNTMDDDPMLQRRQQKASNAFSQINKLIRSYKHSLAIARSNRERIYKKNEYFTITEE